MALRERVQADLPDLLDETAQGLIDGIPDVTFHAPGADELWNDLNRAYAAALVDIGMKIRNGEITA